MASLAVMTAVENRIASAWLHAPVIYPNTKSAPRGDGGPFLTVSYPIAEETQISLGAPGSNLFRETGAIRFLLSVPFGSGLKRWDPWIGELRALFRAQTFDGVVTWEAPPPASRRGDDASRWEISFAVPYRYDIFG
jgi:hypothetical protein